MTTYREFTYDNDEWCFSNSVILTADLTLVLSADPHRDIIAGIRLEAVRYTADALCFPRRVPVPLCDLMKSWVATHQPELETERRRHFAEAAE